MGTFYKNNIYNNIIALCESRTPRVSFSKMCVDLGLSKSLGTKLKDDPDKNINGETAKLIADYFGVSVDCVLGDETKKAAANEGDGLSTDKKKLMEFAMQCPDDRASDMLQAMQLFLQNWSK